MITKIRYDTWDGLGDIANGAAIAVTQSHEQHTHGTSFCIMLSLVIDSLLPVHPYVKCPDNCVLLSTQISTPSHDLP
jgi:hypothetical protein